MKRTWCVLTALLAVAASLIPDAILLAQTGTIRGTVTDSATAFPLEGATVTVVGTALQAQTNPRGQYGITGVSSGDVRVRVQLIGYAPAEQLVTVPDGGETTVDFTLGGRSGPARGDRLGRLRQQCPWRAQYRRVLGRLGPIDNQPIASMDARSKARRPGCRWSRTPAIRGTQ